MFLLHLFHRKNFAPQACELGKFLLNRLQPFMPLTVSVLGLGFIPLSKPIVMVHLLNVSNLGTKATYLFPKNIEVIHVYQDSASRGLKAWTHRSGPKNDVGVQRRKVAQVLTRVELARNSRPSMMVRPESNRIAERLCDE
jgi:hypothetical protein